MDFLNVKKQQKRFLEQILDISTASDGLSTHWKILIYDETAKNLISPVVSLQTLRKLGVTLHLSLFSKREAVPVVAVIYLIKPTEKNINKIKEDCQRGLYDEIHIHFIEPASKPLLEFLAKSMVEVGAAHLVKKVFDQFINFVSLEKDLFSLAVKNSFSRYNLPSLQETAVMNCMEEVCSGLLNAVTCLKICPIIRCPKGGPSSLLAKLLANRLRALNLDNDYQEAFLLKNDGKSNQQSLEELSLSSQRPILLIVDRGVDLSSMLFHSSGYETLVDDLLKISSNRVKIPGSEEQKEKVYSLDSENDEFWSSYAGNMIPEAVENHSTELQRVSAQVARIKQQTGNDFEQSDSNAPSSSLLKTVESLPLLLEKKKLLEMHLEIIKTTMSGVSDREIYNFAEIEEKMISRHYCETQEVLKLLKKETLQFCDKCRLVAVFLLTANARPQDISSVYDVLLQIKSDLQGSESKVKFKAEDEEAINAVLYIKKLQSMSSTSLQASLEGDSSKEKSTSLWKLADRAAQGILEAQKKVKGMVTSSSLLPLVQMLDLVTRPAESGGSLDKSKVDEEFQYFDPKIGSEEIPEFQRFRGTIKTGILFVLGGGCYSEYQNLKAYCNNGEKEGGLMKSMNVMSSSKNEQKRFVYGCTEMLNASEFMSQVSQCYSA